jgi:hypothetical protein
LAHGLATLWLDGTLEDRVGPVDIEAIAGRAFDVLLAGGQVDAAATGTPTGPSAMALRSRESGRSRTT